MINLNSPLYITSDAGTLLYLGDQKDSKDHPRFLITSYTPLFASSELI